MFVLLISVWFFFCLVVVYSVLQILWVSLFSNIFRFSITWATFWWWNENLEVDEKCLHLESLNAFFLSFLWECPCFAFSIYIIASEHIVLFAYYFNCYLFLKYNGKLSFQFAFFLRKRWPNICSIQTTLIQKPKTISVHTRQSKHFVLLFKALMHNSCKIYLL